MVGAQLAQTARLTCKEDQMITRIVSPYSKYREMNFACGKMAGQGPQKCYEVLGKCQMNSDKYSSA